MEKAPALRFKVRGLEQMSMTDSGQCPDGSLIRV